MNDQPQQPAFSPLDETLVVPALDDTPAKACRPRMEIVEGSGPHLTAETQVLLRLRLKAAAIILLIGFAAFLVRHVIGVLTGEPLHPLLLGCHILVCVALTLSAMRLCRQCPLSMRKLQIAELVVFGLPAIFFLLLQHRVTLDDVARGFMPPPMPFWLLLIFTYALFIPNTWQRAAVVIGVMALTPALLVVVMMLAHWQVAAVITAMDFAQHVLTMLVAAVAAVCGTHVINTLRREAFEARRLGQYQLLARLGQGGMGEVHLAEH